MRLPLSDRPPVGWAGGPQGGGGGACTSGARAVGGGTGLWWVLPTNGLGSVRTRGFIGACACPSLGGAPCIWGGGERLPSTRGAAGQRCVAGAAGLPMLWRTVQPSR